VGVKLEAFVKLFDEKSGEAISKQKDRVSKKESQVAEFMELRATAISAATEFGTEEDLQIISETFPEEGGMNNDKFRVYTNELFGGQFEEEIRALFKRRNAKPQLDGAKKSLARYEALKDAGGESWFKQYMSAVGSKIAETTSLGAITADKLFEEFFPKEFDEDNADEIAYVLDYDAYPEPPRGIHSSIELYEAAREYGNPLNRTEESVDEEVKEVVVPEPPVEAPVEEKVQDILNEDAIQQEEEKAQDEEEFGPIEPINDTEEKPVGDINKIIEPSINTEEVVPRKVVRIGSKGEDVAFLQKALGIESDGKFGPITKKAVIAFQTANGLDPDGIVGPKTWSALGKIENVETSSKIEVSTPEVQAIESLPIEETQDDVIEEPTPAPAQNVINEAGDITNIENTTVEGETLNQVINESPVTEGEQSLGETSSVGEESSVFDNIMAINNAPEGASVTPDLSSPEVAGVIESQSDVSESGLDQPTESPSGDNISNFNSFGDVINENLNQSTVNPGMNESITNFNSMLESGDVIGAISSKLDSVTNNISNSAESFVSGGTSGIMESIKDTSSVTNNNAIEVSKETTNLDKSFAPLASSNQMSSTENKSSSEVNNTSSSTSSTENIDGSVSTVDNSTTSSSTSDVDNSKSASISNNSFDTSALELRLRRIENLLVGPLDVKIIES